MDKLGDIDLSWVTQRLSPLPGHSVHWGNGDAAVDQLRCGYLLPQRSWIRLGHETMTTHEESPPKK